MGEITVLCEQGDIKIEWTVGDAEKTDRACAEFEQLKEAGFEFFLESEGKRRKRIKEFDPKLGKLTAAPGVQRKRDRPTPQKPEGSRQKAMAGGPNASLVLPRRP